MFMIRISSVSRRIRNRLIDEGPAIDFSHLRLETNACSDAAFPDGNGSEFLLTEMSIVDDVAYVGLGHATEFRAKTNKAIEIVYGQYAFFRLPN